VAFATEAREYGSLGAAFTQLFGFATGADFSVGGPAAPRRLVHYAYFLVWTLLSLLLLNVLVGIVQKLFLGGGYHRHSS
jgi:hypothetical protein